MVVIRIAALSVC